MDGRAEYKSLPIVFFERSVCFSVEMELLDPVTNPRTSQS